MQKTIIGAAAVLLSSAAVASAATLSFLGTGQSETIMANDLGLGLDGSTVQYISGDTKTPATGLSVDGPAMVTYTYLGFEAGNTNFAQAMGGTVFANMGTGASMTGATFSTMQGAGLLNFAFGTTAPAANASLFANDGVATPAATTYAIGYLRLSDTSYYLLFDDIAAGDRDYDDLGVRVDVADLPEVPGVPLPAAGLLLVGALGGLGVFKRRRRAA